MAVNDIATRTYDHNFRLDPIVRSLLDTDFYKLTMMQAVLHNYPNAEVEWEFRCRNSEDLTPYLA